MKDRTDVPYDKQVRYYCFKNNCKFVVQNSQEIKRTLFDRMKQDKTCKFSRNSSFSSYVQHKHRKNKQLIQLILCQLDVRRLAEGKGHETESYVVCNLKKKT